MKFPLVFFTASAIGLLAVSASVMQNATAADAAATPPATAPGVTVVPGTGQKVAPVLTPHLPPGTTVYNIRDFGAVGDGLTIDSDAVNRAIDAAAANGGGTVYFPAGYYLCYSIHLKTNITLYLDQGSWIVAAETPAAVAALQPRGGRGGFGAGGPGGGRGGRGGRGGVPATTRGGTTVDTASVAAPAAPAAIANPAATVSVAGAPPAPAATATPETAAAPAEPATTVVSATGEAAAPPNPDFPPPLAAGAREAFLSQVPAGAKMYDLIEENMWYSLRNWTRPANAGEGATPSPIDETGPAPIIAQYQDFGHSFWHNSLIWGENITNVSIIGPGMIYGRGLSRGDGPTNFGGGDKTISLKNCRNVILKDFTVWQGGWFCLLATGVDNLTVSNLKIDTNRDGFDIDCCKNVRISDCFVNSPQDDGICLKSSFALGYSRSTDNVTITNCQVSGYVCGTFLDGTYVPYGGRNDGGGAGTGRIKFGTESNGGFRNITISNCVFTHCRGLAMESVDGAIIEDVTVNNIAMRDVTNAPIYIRLGRRLRGPAETTTVGAIRRVNISNLEVSGAVNNSCIIIAGNPGHPVEDVHLSNIRILYQGNGGKELADINPPEDEIQGGRVTFYPEPGALGTMPAYGMFARHVKGLAMDHVTLEYSYPDFRPPVILDDVADVSFEHFTAERETGIPFLTAWNVHNLSTQSTMGVADTQAANLTEGTLPPTAKTPAAAAN
ncbi:MAG TPA: glycosyl hydrolase family 28 protein [Opitutales bacterium]|nr:glycosyl hydrolase family 28 protein [Opitutales bacterium]